MGWYSYIDIFINEIWNSIQYTLVAGVSGWAWKISMLIFPSVLVIIGGALIYKTHYLGSVFMWIGGLMLVIGYLSGASLFGIHRIVDL